MGYGSLHNFFYSYHPATTNHRVSLCLLFSAPMTHESGWGSNFQNRDGSTVLILPILSASINIFLTLTLYYHWWPNENESPALGLWGRGNSTCVRLPSLYFKTLLVVVNFQSILPRGAIMFCIHMELNLQYDKLPWKGIGNLSRSEVLKKGCVWIL
jgi:hypothetical protein